MKVRNVRYACPVQPSLWLSSSNTWLPLLAAPLVSPNPTSALFSSHVLVLNYSFQVIVFSTFAQFSPHMFGAGIMGKWAKLPQKKKKKKKKKTCHQIPWWLWQMQWEGEAFHKVLMVVSWTAGTGSAPQSSITNHISPSLKKQNSQGDYHKQYLLSRMVGLFLWRIFLNFPLKSLGGNGSRGKLAMRPRTTSSRPSEQSVSLSAMSLTALSSEDMLDGREPTATSIILPEESFEALPGFFLSLFCKCSI